MNEALNPTVRQNNSGFQSKLCHFELVAACLCASVSTSIKWGWKHLLQRIVVKVKQCKASWWLPQKQCCPLRDDLEMCGAISGHPKDWGAAFNDQGLGNPEMHETVPIQQKTALFLMISKTCHQTFMCVCVWRGGLFTMIKPRHYLCFTSQSIFYLILIQIELFRNAMTM